MTRYIAVCCTAAILALLVGCSSSGPAVNQAAEIKAIKDIETQWNKDFESKDAAKLAAHYTEDAVLMTSGMPPSKGKGAILTMLTAMVKDPALAMKFQTEQVEVAKAGDLAYTQGTYAMTMTDPATKRVVNDKGTYLTVYRKGADGLWKAAQDAAISSLAAPEATAAPAAKPAAHPAKKKGKRK